MQTKIDAQAETLSAILNNRNTEFVWQVGCIDEDGVLIVRAITEQTGARNALFVTTQISRELADDPAVALDLLDTICRETIANILAEQ